MLKSEHRPCRARKVWVWLALTDKWLVILTAPASLAIGTAQLVQKLFRRDQIGRAETLREAVIDRPEAGAGIGGAALIAQQAGEACGGAQLPRQTLLLARR